MVIGSAERVMSSTDWPVFWDTPRLPVAQRAQPAHELADERLVDAVVGAQGRQLARASARRPWCPGRR